MITNTGKNILAKFLLGHTSSYASHIAIGCGSKPLSVDDDPDTYASEYENKDALDFEMFRVPITSRGYVKENDLTYVVLTAEMPTTERYGITEVGIFSAGSNPEAGAAGSRLVQAFADLENWEQHTATTAASIDTLTDALDPDGDNSISINDRKFFKTSSNNPTFLYEDRILRQEVPRFLDSSIVARGDSAEISVNENNNLIINEDVSSHIHLTGVSLGIDQNAPSDELVLAFSLINAEGQDPDIETIVADPQEVRIVVEFASGEGNDTQSAKMEIALANIDDGGDYDFSANRYFVVRKQLQELTTTVGFAWENVTIIKAYVSVIDDDEKSSNYYVAFDGLRIENKTDIHPLYGLTGYSVIKNDDGIPIIKESNSSNFVEFRFGFQLDQYAGS